MAEIVNIQFPTGGINEGTPIVANSPPQCLDAKNVRAWDVFDRRNRGGQRSGIVKLTDTQPNSLRIQNLTPVVEAVPLVVEAGFGNKLNDPSPGFEVVPNFIEFSPSGGFVAAGDEFDLFSNSNAEFAIFPWDSSNGFGTLLDTGDFLNIKNVAWHPTEDAIAIGEYNQFDDDIALFVFEFSPSSGLGLRSNEISWSRSSGSNVWLEWHPDGDVLFVVKGGGTTTGEAVAAYDYTLSTNTLGSLLFEKLLSFDPTGLDITSDGGTVFTVDETNDDMVAIPFNKSTGFGSLVKQGGFGTGDLHHPVRVSPNDDFVIAADGTNNKIVAFPWDGSSLGSPVLSEALGSDLRYFDWHPSQDFVLASAKVSGSPDEQVLFALPWSGSFGSASSSTVVTGEADNPAPLAATPDGSVVVASGDTASTKQDVRAWEFTTGSTNATARDTNLLSVQDGNVYKTSDFTGFALVTSGSGVFEPTAVVNSGTLLQQVFFADGTASGYQYFDVATNAVKDWATDVTTGSLPVGNNDATVACRLLTIYRGRVVLSGLRESPENWFMSRSGDPFDWDFSQEDALAAVAGNASDAGQLGDLVTALAPFQDDLMFIGGANSLWIMSGDPAAGGRLDQVADNVGIVSSNAWVFSPGGQFFFLGRNGLYKVTSASSPPENISSERLDQFLVDIDYSKSRATLVYDSKWQGVHVFFEKTTEPTTPPVHLFWDERNDAFWKDEYPAPIGPSAVTPLASDGNRTVSTLLGGFDGWVRQFKDDAVDDDGTGIESEVLFPLIAPTGVVGETRLDDLNLRLDDESTDLEVSVASGRNAEEALDRAQAGTFKYVRTLPSSTESQSFRQRVRGNAMLIRLRKASGTTGTWAYEAGQAVLQNLSRVRR